MTDETTIAKTGAAPDRPGLPAVEHLEVTRGAVGGVRARDVNVRMGAVGGVAASTVTTTMGSVGGILARESHVSRGVAQTVIAQHSSVETAFVRAAIAQNLVAGPKTFIGIAIAQNISGEARVLLDWRGGLALGVAAGSILAVARFATRARR